MEPNSKVFSCPTAESSLLPQATSGQETFKRLDLFLDEILLLYRDAPLNFRESLALRLRERVITTLAEADYDNTLRKRDTLGTGMNEEIGAEQSGNEDMNTKRDGEEDGGLPSYSIEDPASENGNRVSPQQNTTPIALSQASVILGVNGKRIMIAKEATFSPYDPSTLGFSKLCLSKRRKRSASTGLGSPQSLDGSMDIDTDEGGLVDNWNPVKMGTLGEQCTADAGRCPARKRKKN